MSATGAEQRARKSGRGERKGIYYDKDYNEREHVRVFIRRRDVTITRLMTFAYDRALARARARAGGTGKIADIRYGGERRAGRGYRDVRVGKTGKPGGGRGEGRAVKEREREGEG